MTSPHVGILTFHHSLNYGAVLQSYALCRLLREKGYRADIIDYRPQWTRRFYFKPLVPRSIKEWRRRERFRIFLKGLKSFPYYFRWQLRQTRYDVYIAGSDQIWNTASSASGYDPSMFLDFVRPEARRIAYAASASGAEALKSEAIPLLARFDHVSVRDAHTHDLIAPYCTHPISICLDPTLLYEWTAVAGSPREAHVFVHTPKLRPLPEMDTALRKLRSFNTNAFLAIEHTPFDLPGINTVLDAGPIQWVQAVASSSYVVTNRFHAFIFALLFRKKVLWLNRRDAFHKVYALLTQLGIPIQRDDFNQPFIWFDNLQYDLIHERLTQLRESSLAFLWSSLQQPRDKESGDGFARGKHQKTA